MGVWDGGFVGWGGGSGPFLRRTRETLVRRIWFEGCEGGGGLVVGFVRARVDGLAYLVDSYWHACGLVFEAKWVLGV